jgi:4-amino-4-deoxy-L-arabinose transferase-like glycosyltransferase
MRLSAPFHAVDRTAGRWRDVLIDPARRERAILISLAFYVLVWTAYGTIAKSSQGLHPDMTEIVAWSRDLSLGYLKHPPFAAWIAWLWFALFPVAGWSYYLLAMLMPAIALWIFWKLSADYLDIEKRIVGLALLTFVPFFNFHALKFNVNTVLLPLWAATTWFFLRSFRTRTAPWAAAAGAMAAVCMLGKYWSIFLLAGLALAALIDNRRIAYFRTAAPWITIAAGLIVLAPHIVWLVQNDFAPFSYAAVVHGVKPFATTLVGALGYIAGTFGYVVVPVIVVLLIARPKPATLADMAWPHDTERRLAAAAFWAPMLLPALGAIVGRIAITSLWSMPAFTLLPVLLLSPPTVMVPAIDTRRVLLGAAVLPLAMLIVSPAIAVMAQRASPLPAAAHARLLATEVERLWHQITPQPLRFVGGEADLAYGVATFASSRPRALIGMPQPSAAELTRSGSVLVCFGENGDCRREAGSRGVGAKVISTEIVRNYFGFAGKPQRYTIVIAPPR